MLNTKSKSTTAKLRSVAYLRRSTDRQEQSIPDQKKVLQDYAAEEGYSISKFYIDDAISGTSTGKRKAFLQMIQDAQSKSRNFNFILVYDVKRFGRIDNDEAGYYRHLLRQHGVEVVYATENFSGDGTDDLLRPVKQWQARQESKDLSKVTIRGQISKIESDKEGPWMGGTPPYGYDLQYMSDRQEFLFVIRFQPDGSKLMLDAQRKLIRHLEKGESVSTSKRDYCKLIFSEAIRVKTIRRIFHMYCNESFGFGAIADTLNRENVEAPRNKSWAKTYSGKWSDTSIRAMITNPIYAGDMVWNRRTDARFHRIEGSRAVERERIHGRRLAPNHQKDWIVVRNAHPALLSRVLFEKALKLRESKSPEKDSFHPSAYRGRRSRFALAGLCRCALCGERYQGITRIKGKRRKNGSKTKTFYYGCAGHLTKGNSFCRINMLPWRVLEDLVFQSVVDYYKPFLAADGRQKLAELVKSNLKLEKNDLGKAKQKANLDLNEVQKTIDSLLDNLNSKNRDLLDERLKTLSVKRQKIQNHIEELDLLQNAQNEVNDIVIESSQFIAGLEIAFRDGVPEEKKNALRNCVKVIKINKPKQEIQITLKKIPNSTVEGVEEVKTILTTQRVMLA